MKIEKFSKGKGNTYKVTFNEDLVITLYDDVIIKYNLLVNKQMDEKKFKEITSYNDELEAYYKSIKYINRKLRSKKEMKTYLEKEYSSSIVKKTIEKLEKDGYLNENIFITAYVNDQINLTLNGPHKIEKDLLKLGLEEDAIQKELRKVENGQWSDRIEKLIRKRLKSNHNHSASKLKEKIYYDLGNLGYRKEKITQVLETIPIETHESVILKEGNKIYQKLEKKYQEEQLLYYFRNKMFQKGFSFSEIELYLQKKN